MFASIRQQFQSRVDYELQLYLVKSLRDLFFLALEFFIENTAVQMISSVPHIHIPLRDLGYELLLYLNAQYLVYINLQISVESIAIIWILVCFLHGKQGITYLQKSARCLTIVRSLRICLFSLTVLPSPRRRCHFRGPINPFKARINGVCNDLLYSGHVTVYTLVGISLTLLSKRYSSKSTRYLFRICLWFYLIQRIILTILQRHHYSIDMFLGFVITLLIWQCQIFYYDLPTVPKHLFLHLKHLFFPKSHSILKQV